MEQLRPAPDLANTRARVLEFIKRYFAQVGRSPGQREIARGIRSTRRQVQNALQALASEGAIMLAPGAHGISLPDPVDQLSEGDVLRLLQARGWIVNLQAAVVGIDTSAGPLPCLPLLGELDHIPDVGA